MEGTLYIVATPIGNLEDITFRAIKILKEVDFIVAEDTRRTKILLNHYNINKKMLSYYEYNKLERTPFIIKEIKSGKQVALVSDSGTPGICDPGFYLVRECIRNNICVSTIPGPTALISALVVSGLPTDKFVFEGWFPRKSGRRKKRLKELIDMKHTIVFFESPYRIIASLNDCLEILGDRDAVITRELTKKFESITRGKISELIEIFSKNKPKGEFVVIISGSGKRSNKK